MATKTDSQLQFTSMKAAAATSGIPYSALQCWKDQGVAGFDRSGRVDLKTVLSSVFARSDSPDIAPPPGMKNWREAVNRATAQRLTLKLEQERGRLVELAWVASRIQEAGGTLKAHYHKSIAEHPVRLAACTGDVAATREVLRDAWGDIFVILQSLGDHFAEQPTANRTEEHENR